MCWSFLRNAEYGIIILESIMIVIGQSFYFTYALDMYLE